MRDHDRSTSEDDGNVFGYHTITNKRSAWLQSWQNFLRARSSFVECRWQLMEALGSLSASHKTPMEKGVKTDEGLQRGADEG